MVFTLRNDQDTPDNLSLACEGRDTDEFRLK